MKVGKMNLKQYASQVERELIGNILPFSAEKIVDRENGGFYGYVSNDLMVDKRAPKGVIQCARLLWTFSHAHRVLPDRTYLEVAGHAYEYLLDRFWDRDHEGLYWMLDYTGSPVDTKKKIYGQAFGIYGLSEYHLATGDGQGLQRAVDLYRLVEEHSYDGVYRGYYEGTARDWTPAGDVRLDETDPGAKKTMNTNLHLLEAYTNLLRIWDSDDLRVKLRELILVTLDHIVDPETAHFRLYFDEDWRSRLDRVSYGHDIEGSWLLVEAVEGLGDAALLSRVRDTAARMAQAVYDEGLDRDGGLFYEGDPAGIVDADKVWWAQAEAMVGFLSAYQLTGRQHFLEASLRAWEFVDRHIVDKVHGEWFGAIAESGRPLDGEKAGLWKSAYHNSRACIEVMRRLRETGEAAG